MERRRLDTAPVTQIPYSVNVDPAEADLFATISSVAGDISGLAEHSLKPLLANLDRTVTLLGDLVEEARRQATDRAAAASRSR